jgi:hypothetical protein
MKKRVPKKLTLHRETLRPLETEEVERAQGAAPSGRPICCTATASCPPPSATTC